MELTSLYQKNDPRHENMLSKSYKEADKGLGEKTKKDLQSSKYKKRGPYQPPISSNTLVNEVASPVMCISSFHPQADSNGRFVEQPLIITGHKDGSISIFAMKSMNLLYFIAAAEKSDNENHRDDKRKLGRLIEQTAQGHAGAVMDLLVYQPPGESLLVIVSASVDKTVKITNVYSGQLLGTFDGHTKAVCSVDMLLQHNLEPIVVSSSFDGSVCVWSLVDMVLIRRIDCSAGAVFKATIFVIETSCVVLPTVAPK